MRDNRNICRFLVGRAEEWWDNLGGYSRRWDDNIKVVKGKELEGVNRILLALFRKLRDIS
jgi:hypothetical protein